MPPRYLTCVLICEGSSDRWFLSELLRRAVDDICLETADRVVEVVVEYVHTDHQRPTAILEALIDAGRFDLVLYHHDGAPSESAQAKVSEVCRSLAGQREEPIVTVVPVRETEAWMLADPDAIAAVLGVRPAKVLAAGVPARAKEVEDVQDPKKVLKGVIGTITGHGTGLKIAREDLFLTLAENTDLARLREVPSFARWWTDMSAVLAELRYKK
jgi:hypothetical protein